MCKNPRKHFFSHTSKLKQFWVYWGYFLHSVPGWPVSHLTLVSGHSKDEICFTTLMTDTTGLSVPCHDWFWEERAESELQAFLALFQGMRLEWALAWGDGPCHWLTSPVGRLYHQHCPDKDTWPSPCWQKKWLPAITKQRATATWNSWRRPPSVIWTSRMMMAWHPRSWQPTTATSRPWK